jgi:hypothetical protein
MISDYIKGLYVVEIIQRAMSPSISVYLVKGDDEEAVRKQMSAFDDRIKSITPFGEALDLLESLDDDSKYVYIGGAW